jgi:guanyl-specific ribonuclease Sa
MKWLTRISMPSILTVILMLLTLGVASAQTSVGINGSSSVRIAANAVLKARSTYPGIYKKTPSPATPCQIKRNPDVPDAAFTLFSYLLAHNYSPPKGYKGNTVYGNTTHKLPNPPSGYRWFEYDVYSGSYGRSPDRIVTARTGLGLPEEYPYYSPDHYGSFKSMFVCE